MAAFPCHGQEPPIPELQVINPLNTKTGHLRSQIARFERGLEETKAFLPQVLAITHLFQPPLAGEDFPTH